MAETKQKPVSERLKELRERAGLSMAAMSKALGYRFPSGYQRYEDPSAYKKSYLPPEMVQTLTVLLPGKGEPPITRDEVIELGGGVPLVVARNMDPFAGSGGMIGLLRHLLVDAVGKGDIHFLNDPLFGVDQQEWQKRAEMAAGAKPSTMLPVYGQAAGGDNGAFLLNGETVDRVRCPPALLNVQGAFAVYVMGDSMSPRYEPGELVFVHPTRPPSPGDDVIVEMIGDHGEPGPSYLKRLVRRTSDRVRVKQFNPPRDDIDYEAARIKRIYRVMSATELLQF
ncbi:LexA family transcriptional regulator [Oceanibaculum indicum]|uniref:Peptidase S24-like protein n=1 Tax=Oceanibaculum indicum TaxID=526216 RepID=A0A420WGN5_9PROT|nr:helix-turn-helix transcriptional regulator [Oceanibaculum indicum]RKQ70151.1 peptidase S24-like protein [Oceanibaculum indicum]